MYARPSGADFKEASTGAAQQVLQQLQQLQDGAQSSSGAAPTAAAPKGTAAAAAVPPAAELDGGGAASEHPKSRLNVYVGQRPELGGLRYEVLEDSGPQAPQRFLVGVRLGGRLLSSCRGKNQKLASTAAAQAALDLLVAEAEGRTM